MKLKFEIKRFSELSLHELYQVLMLRSEVFIIEQNCVYQDIDGKDEKALHLLGIYNDKVVAYSRLFAPGAYFDSASIGRVVISPNYRDRKWGHDMLAKAIAAIASEFGTTVITISAQLYLKKFYESHGFVQQGAEYLEDGIPHIRMDRS